MIIRSMNSRWFQALPWAIVALAAALTLVHLNAGSIPNSDDALYAQVVRQAASGDLLPLQFGESEFKAKPPLFFWLGAVAVHLFGDHEASYRLVAALSFLLMLILMIGLLRTPGRGLEVFWVPLLLLGSPLLIGLSNRVMLDVPLTLAVVAMTLVTLRSIESGQPRFVFWVWAIFGWSIKEIGVLPALVGNLAAIAWLAPRQLVDRKQLWGGLLFLGSVSLTFFLHQGAHPFQWNTAAAAKSAVLTLAPPFSIYLDAIAIDSPFLFLIPFGLGLWIWKLTRGSAPRAWTLIAVVTLTQIGAIAITQTRLPHYLAPAFALSLVWIGLMLGGIRGKLLHTVLLLLIVFQGVRANTFRWDPTSPEIDPAPETKAISLATQAQVPANHPICVVNVYFPGVYFYAQRPVVAIYTTEVAYQAVSRVAEFEGRVFFASPDQLRPEIQSRCQGYAIVPTAMLDSSLEAPDSVLKQGKRLAWIRMSGLSPSNP